MSRGDTDNKGAKSKLTKGNNDVTRESSLSSNVKRNKEMQKSYEYNISICVLLLGYQNKV